MKRLLMIGLLLVPTMVQAQQLPSEYSLKLKAPQVDLIGKALSKLPFEEVADLMQSMRVQVIEQQQPKKPVDKEPAVKEPDKP